MFPLCWPADLRLLALLLLGFVSAPLRLDAGEPPASPSTAEKILAASGVQGGIVVHLGCGDGRLTAALRVDDRLTVHGPEPDPALVAEVDPADPDAAFEGRRGARLAAISAADGAPLAQLDLDSPPVFDGLIAAGGQLLLAQENGTLACLRPAAR